MLSRFTRTLVIVAAGAILLLLGTGAEWPAFVAVGLVFAVAIVQHAALSELSARRTREIIQREDPDRPTEVGAVAAAVRQRITAERSDAERQNADLRAALESTAVGVVIADREGLILNTVGSLAGLIPRGASARVKQPALLRMFERVVNTGEAQMETLTMGPRGEVKQWIAVPLEGDAVGAVVTDVTEVHRVHAMRTNFVTDASHELKTPIAAIQAASEALQSAIGRDEERSTHFARRLEEQAVRLGRIVNDLLDLSRLEASAPETKPFRLDRAVEGEMRLVADEAASAGVEMSSSFVEVEIDGSESDVRLAVRNLITNAIRYTPEGGRVEIEVRRDGDEAVVVVADSGLGISASDQERVFERFFRVDSARSRATGGTGLGLSIVRHVMANHGGVAEVESVIGHGSTFTLRFPLGT